VRNILIPILLFLHVMDWYLSIAFLWEFLACETTRLLRTLPLAQPNQSLLVDHEQPEI
jgi:hypothetical protein